MVSPLSGSREDVELVQIESKNLSLILKGKPYHERYEGLKKYRVMDFHDLMQFSVNGDNIESIKVYDVNQNCFVEDTAVRPIFFENGVYQLIVISKQDKELTFYHEHPLLRQAIAPVRVGHQTMLMGNLQFQNEIGFTTFEIKEEGKVLLEVTLEIFPSKLDYKKDYQKLLEEVNEEIYNLAYHFIRKTYLGAKLKLEGNPSRAEFYRLLSYHFKQFLQSITRIERQPHHQLRKTHEKARGDQLGKLDSVSRNYLKKHANVFVEVEKGIPIGKRRLMPTSGLRMKKKLTYDTNENRYIKWTMERLIYKLKDLLKTVQKQNNRFKKNMDTVLVEKIKWMISQLQTKRRLPFWRDIGKLDRSVMSLVLQMEPSYREAFKIYLTVSKGLVLQGKIYQLSLKDVATLYEYWTFLKLGQILGKSYKLISQDVVQVNREGLFVNLEANRTAKREYLHPVTKEKITLIYQKREAGLPTVNQKPDTMLSIEKKGKTYTFNYIFDAKYRVDYALDGSYYQNYYQSPGPMEDDINTMHRYRDSIVAENNGPYERTAFGAYVLFPWFDEVTYQNHHFYQSINKVNIGALPFLPNANVLVERFIQRLVDKGPEELQQEGILPQGTIEEWESSIEEPVLLGLVSTKKDYEQFIRDKYYFISVENLKRGWQKAKYVALYVKKGLLPEHGVLVYGEISNVKPGENKDIIFEINVWINLSKPIKPVRYGIANSFITTLEKLKEASELPELFMKSKEEVAVWKMVRRVSDQIKLDLDHTNLDYATFVRDYRLDGMNINMDRMERKIIFNVANEEEIISFDQLNNNPSGVFRLLVKMMEIRNEK